MDQKNSSFNFNQEIKIGEDISTFYHGKSLILKEVYIYNGPITMQYLPYGGIQSVYDNHIILHTKNGFIASDQVIYDGIHYTAKEFIDSNPDLVNEVLPS